MKGYECKYELSDCKGEVMTKVMTKVITDIKQQISNKQTKLRVLCREVRKIQETISLLYEALKEIENEEIQDKIKQPD